MAFSRYLDWIEQVQHTRFNTEEAQSLQNDPPVVPMVPVRVLSVEVGSLWYLEKKHSWGPMSEGEVWW